MISIIAFVMAIALLIAGVITPFLRPSWRKFAPITIAGGVILSASLLLSISFYSVPSGQVGHLNRRYFGSSMAEGQLIAQRGQNGPQAETLSPGVHFRPLLQLIYDVESFPVVSVPNGQYGLLTAKAGAPLADEAFLADAWLTESVSDMLRAEYFLSHGGQKGTQLTVLQPGQYRLNHYLFDVSLQPALEVPVGSVAVVRSNVDEQSHCSQYLFAGGEGKGDELAVQLVPTGCRGVWREPLMPGSYYLNRMAYEPTLIPTQAQALIYSGGYARQSIELIADRNGNVHEEIHEELITLPDGATDEAIRVTVEGWVIPIEVRTVIQVDPQQAPILLAGVGDTDALVATLVTPALENAVRDVVQTDEQQVLELINRQASLEADVESIMQAYGQRIGVSIQAVRFGEIALPAELLAAQQRQILAEQLQAAFIKEQATQEARIETEKTRAVADQQGTIVEAEIGVEIASRAAVAAQIQGEGEKLRLQELQEVLSNDEILRMTLMQELLSVARENPDVIKVPTVYVTGSGNDAAGSAAVLGATNLLEFLASQEEIATNAISDN